jgi:type IV pilus assembly protein PilB
VSLSKFNLYALLESSAIISNNRLAQAATIASEQGLSLFSVLIEQKYAEEKDIFPVIADYLNIPFELIDRNTLDPKVSTLIPEYFSKDRHVLPLFQLGDILSVAITDPFDLQTIEEIETITSLNVNPILTLKSNIGSLQEYCYSYQLPENGTEDSSMSKLFELGMKLVQEKQISDEDLGDLAKEAPIAKLVDSIIKRAVKEKASDIHIEPADNVVRIRYRIDGLLKDVLTPPKKLAKPIISRLKILSNLDITETRKPQDGRVTFSINDKLIDFRVSTINTISGEKLALRILDKSGAFVSLENLGLLEDSLNKVQALISATSGIIIVSGPTGSGKTSTLYAALSKLNSSENNIITIEDPIEYNLDRINQIQVRPKLGLNFNAGLTAIMRQDPDIIMVGEIRDVPTAETAMHAALTGHLVFTTLHTRNAAGSITRLMDMGIEPFLINSAIVGAIGQRLVRKICPNCKRLIQADYYTNFKEKQLIAQLQSITDTNLQLFKGLGCHYCDNSGYKGRTGIFEIMLLGDDLKNLIQQKANSEKLYQTAKILGMESMKEDGLKKVLSGITTIEEIARVLDL